MANLSLNIIQYLYQFNQSSMETATPYIKNKKEKSGRVFYLVCQGNRQKWYDFDEMSDYVQMVINYEKRSSYVLKSNANSMVDEQQNKQPQNSEQQEIVQQDEYVADDEIIQNSQSKPNQVQAGEKIVQLRFEKKVGSQLYFYVEKRNGMKNILTNNDLKKIDPLALIAFYESFIVVQKN